jgi:zinc finger SWIM domain-containing protein 3
MLDKYGLRENEWLQRWFEKRKQWALVYGKNTFSAQMTTTQRSESMNKQHIFYHFKRLVADKKIKRAEV